MNLTRDRVRSIGWVTLLTFCLALTAALTLRVNAVKSEVHHAERRIIHMRGEITFLETEYQTRSNQHQLRSLNDIEFGYTAPRAQQYIEGARQLAVIGQPRGPSAPAPIRVAHGPGEEMPAPFLKMLSPVTGEPAVEPAPRGDAPPANTARDLAAAKKGDPIGAAIDAEHLGERLARIGPDSAPQQ